jgi:hypothetical protein
MLEREVTMHDILNVLNWGEVIEVREDPDFGNWVCKVRGIDIEKEQLTVVAAIDEKERSVICKTVY